MATIEAVVHKIGRHEYTRAREGAGLWITAALTLMAVAVHGYHPYVEDGGVYLAGIKHSLAPQLYPAWSGFVSAHLHFSVFAPVVAWLVRLSGLGLMGTMFALYVLSTWLTLEGAWALACRCTDAREGRAGAVVLLALMLTVPIAGTSLMLMDPYVTARSISTPCGLFALAAAVDVIREARAGRRIASSSAFQCVSCLALGCAVHPLMGGYALACVLILGAVSLRPQRRATACTVGLCSVAVALAGLLEWMWPRPSAAYRIVAQTRSYWFLGNWQWYEILGLIAPLLLMVWFYLTWGKRNASVRLISTMSVAAGVTAVVTALLFARQSSPAYMVARLQPLRIFQLLYVVMIALLGMRLGETWLKRKVWRWALLILSVGSVMVFVQQQTFPSSNHLEFPGRAPSNPWEQSFLWIQSHTRRDARFALDANYITAPREDSQNFRAIAERSSMPDDAKDGGIAAIAPQLTPQWVIGEAAQRGLDQDLNPSRIARLSALGIDWVVLPRAARADLACPYENAAVKVCRLPAHGAEALSAIGHPGGSNAR